MSGMGSIPAFLRRRVVPICRCTLQRPRGILHRSTVRPAAIVGAVSLATGGASVFYDAGLLREPQRVSVLRSHVAFELPLRRTDSAGAANQNGKVRRGRQTLSSNQSDELERASAAGMIRRRGYSTQR